MNLVSMSLPEDQYYPGATPKENIVLHFTAGTTAKGAVDTWLADPQHVATAYVVDTDGTVFVTFPAEAWAYHLGVKAAEGNPASYLDKRSIGIEIVNIGPLVRDGGKLYCWPNNFHQVYCNTSETDKYVQVPKWRGYEYFAAFTEPQMAAVASLVEVICKRFNIPKQALAVEDRLSFCLNTAAKFKGITTHCNYRKDKTDVGPAFDWSVLGV